MFVPDPRLQLVLDVIGIAVFAASGALAAVHRGLDLFGVLVLASLTALGGGVLRDLLIGETPPAALREPALLATAIAAGCLVILLHRPALRGLGPDRRNGLTVAFQAFDAAGLGVFCVAGARKALAAGLDPVPAALLGMITGIGGGVLRDLLTGQVPLVLRRELYAVPALIGAGLVVGAARLGHDGPLVAVGAAVLVFTLRILSYLLDWHAPRISAPGP